VKQRHLRLLFLLIGLCPFVSIPTLQAQTATAPDVSLLPGPKPPNVPREWQQLVGTYGPEKMRVIILERNGRLFWHLANKETDERELVLNYKDGHFLLPTADGKTIQVLAVQNSSGSVAYLNVGDAGNLDRADAGSDPAHFYHITFSKPLEQLRTAARSAKPPKEVRPFRKSDLVELAILDPSIHLDIRYAQSDNFLSTPVYTQARAFMQRPAAEALLRVLQKLRPLGYGLLIHDAYRPWYVTKIFWDATPPESHIFVADPSKGSKHNRGCAVDLSLYNLSSGQPIEMPGLYDEMSLRSFPNFPGGTSLQRWHRDLLRRAMESEGFAVNEDEWWHFDYKDWRDYAILNVPFEDLSSASPRL
jgi:D-alanyl-D-alanine dipeptidase